MFIRTQLPTLSLSRSTSPSAQPRRPVLITNTQTLSAEVHAALCSARSPTEGVDLGQVKKDAFLWVSEVA